AQKIAVRHRTDRKGVSERDQSSQFYISFARVRTDGARILLPAGTGGRVARILAAGATEILRGYRHFIRTVARSQDSTGRMRSLFQGHLRYRICIPVRNSGTGGGCVPDGLRPDTTPERKWQALGLFRRGNEAAFHPACR